MIQSPSASSAVRSRRAASGAGSTTSKSARRTFPSLTHSISPPYVWNVTGRHTLSISACV